MEETKIEFKKKKRHGRVRVKSECSDDELNNENSDKDDINISDFEKTRELQKLRKRAAGTNIVTLALGKKVSKIEEVAADADDPFNMNSGGLMYMKDMKNLKKKDDTFDVGTQFFKETHIRDEDDEMRKFVEIEMDKIKGSTAKEEEEEKPVYLTPEDAALLALPEHLRKSTFKKDQQMLSAQMLSGIPEVDLGIEAKIQNIERTEKAKRLLLKDTNLELEPRNLATNYVQHDRYVSEQPTSIGREKERVVKEPIERPNTVNIYQNKEDDIHLRKDNLKGKASDDDAVQRFKDAEKLQAKQNRKK